MDNERRRMDLMSVTKPRRDRHDIYEISVVVVESHDEKKNSVTSQLSPRWHMWSKLW